MVRSALFAAALALGAIAVSAQSDPIAERRQLMKGVAGATKTGAQMVRGATPFDLAKAQEVLKVYAVAADKAHTYFPETAKTGGETKASPKIWENQADFRKRFDDWARDISEAAKATKDLDSFKASFGTLTKACDGCHDTYQLKS